MNWTGRLKFKDGLIPVITQDNTTGQVLMLAYMNRQALLKTLKTKKCHYYSRSRKKLWFKGESSGHIQKVRSIMPDCDMDCLLIKVEQTGGACHTGHMSCFYRKARGARLCFTEKRVFDPKKVY
ncbi:MAG: phosphoribosyl-AMP cyclohydrolase [Candidatus Omnitrophica bacterium]|nr:phosphoribosyl-AMP cyclohydrolase [Candidatus Omnitrophota bacterium]